MAPLFGDDDVSRVRTAADIADVIGEQVALKPAGKNLVGLCPFHGEKTPSFSVSRERQFFHCFGCGAGGDVFDFVMRTSGMNFPEALSHLATRYGVEIQKKPAGPGARKRAQLRDRVLSANAGAADYFQKCLAEPRGRGVKEYLASRGMGADPCREFFVGFAPDGWHNLEEYLTGKGFSQKELLEAGLLTQNDKGRVYDRFRNRVMFPILDNQRRVVGFGGRVMDDSEPKYLNSPQTLVYDKSRVLYGLWLAAPHCRKKGRVLVTEGYFDVMALAASGIKEAVATCGTALSEDHVRILRAFADQAVLVFDADQAGQKAAERGLTLFLSQGMTARALKLPQGHDPDTFVREKGADALGKLADEAADMMDFLLDSAVARHGTGIEGSTRVVEDLKVVLAAVENSVQRSLYIRRVAERLGVAEQAVMERVREEHQRQSRQKARVLARERAGNQPAGPGWETGEPEPEPESEAARGYVQRQPDPPMERQLLQAMAKNEDLAREVGENGLLEHFQSPLCRSVGQVLARRMAGQEEACVSWFEDPRQRSLVAGLCADPAPADDAGCRKLLNQFSMRVRKKARQELIQRISAAEKAGDQQLKAALMTQMKQFAHGMQSNLEDRGAAQDKP